MRETAASRKEERHVFWVSAELWDRWIDLWNGNLDLAEQIIHPDFEVHRIPMPHVLEGLGGRDTLVEWVKQTRSILDGLRFTVEVGRSSMARWSRAVGSPKAHTRAASQARPLRPAHGSASTAPTSGEPRTG
jgi:hypothetical protein